MFNNINYNRFGSNPNRAGFSSIKRAKSKKYLTVKLEEDQTENPPTELQFDETETFDQVYNNKDHTFEETNEMHEVTDPIPAITHEDRELMKMKTMLKFMESSRKSKKQLYAVKL